MTARKYKGTWWVDFYWTQQHGSRVGLRERVRQRSPVDTKRGAEEYERILRDRLQQQSSLSPSPVTPVRKNLSYAEFADEWSRTYVETNVKPSTQERYRQILRMYLVPFFGNMKLDAISAQRIEQFKAHCLTTKLSRTSVNLAMTVLRRSLTSAVEWDHLSAVPRFQWLKTPPPAFDFLTSEESARLLLAVVPEHRAMVVTALRTGLRLGELRALRWEDVDLKAAKVFVRRTAWKNQVGSPKSGRTREVPLSPTAVATLREHRHLRGELVFPSPNGTMMSKDDLKHILPRACKRAGLRVVGWHDLRHSFASQVVMTGGPIKAVQELLGHATIDTTLRYAHLSPSIHVEAVARLDTVTENNERQHSNGGPSLQRLGT